MEPLIEMPVEKWPVVQFKLQSIWPINVAGYYALDVNLKKPQLREAFQFKVFCPYGDIENGLVATIKKPQSSQDCILFPTTQDTTKLEQALVNTKLIDWTGNVNFRCVTSAILKSLDSVRKTMQFTAYDVTMLHTFFLDQKTKLFYDLRFPLNTFVAPVEKVHLQRVAEVWFKSFPNPVDYFSTLASNGLSYGLYSNNKLVAWVFFSEHYFIRHLYCEEEHRRNGYAELLMKHVINEQLKNGNDVYAYVSDGNDKSVGLFRKLGFENVDRGAYIKVQI